MNERLTSTKEMNSVFPSKSLLDSLVIAEAIRDQNAGRPFDTQDLAKALKMTTGTREFRRILKSSTDYGLTEGSWGAKEVSLTPLGSSIVSPLTAKEKAESLRTALFSIEVFKMFYEKYNRSKLPEPDFVQNFLVKELHVPPEDVRSCFEVIIKNSEQLGILIEDARGSLIVRMDKMKPTLYETEDYKDNGESELDSGFDYKEKISTDDLAKDVRKKVPKVFISHGKNTQIVEVVKEILELSGYEPVVAMEEETLAIPISEKVIESMRNCDYGIMNISFDDRELRDDGSYGVNQNVLIEIGAAFVLYNKRVILLADKRVDIPSNLKDLYQCRYEGNQLDGPTTIRLLKTINKFREE